MIVNFANKLTESIYHGLFVKRLSVPLQRSMHRKLIVLDSITELKQLKSPGLMLERLEHDRKGQWGIRVNDQFRVCFRFTDGNCYDVELVDYH